MILPFPLHTVVAALASETIYLHPKTTGALGSNGIYAADSYGTAEEIKANVQPTDGASLRRLPEGLRSSDTLTVWCGASLNDKDILGIREGYWQVEGAAEWYQNGLYYKAIVRKLDSSEVPSGL